MPDSSKKIMPPKPGTTGDTRVRRVPSGPSPWVRENYIKKIKEIIKKKPKPPTPK